MGMVTVVIVFSLFVSLFVFFLYDFSIWQVCIYYASFLFQEESEVPDDETVNQMLARSEEEFELYQVFAQINIFFSWWFSLASPMVYCSS